MIIYLLYLLTFYLLVDVKKISESLMRHILLSQMQSMCVLRLALSMVIVVTEKHQKQLIYSGKDPFFGR